MKRFTLIIVFAALILCLTAACGRTDQTADINETSLQYADDVTDAGTTDEDATEASSADEVAAEADTTADSPAESEAEDSETAEMEISDGVSAVEPEAEVFIDIQNIHGIVFDNQGSMFISRKGNEILKVTPDANFSVFTSLDRLGDKGEKTHIYSMAMGKDNIMYAAAGDRIIKIMPGGEMETLISEDFTGQWGACDVKVDREGNIYVVHGVMVEKYSVSLQKTTLVDGSSGDVKLSAAVGIDFDKDYENLYLGDLFTKTVVKYSLGSDAAGKEPRLFDLSGKNPEYIAVSEHNEAFVSLPGGGGLARISEDGEKTVLCEDVLKEPFTLAFGGMGFDEKSLYVVSQGKVYIVKVDRRGAH